LVISVLVIAAVFASTSICAIFTPPEGTAGREPPATCATDAVAAPLVISTVPVKVAAAGDYLRYALHIILLG
jgi:hypothetical protein